MKAQDFDSCISLVRVQLSQPEKSTRKRAFFSYIRLRRVLLLRSDIRLTPSGIRFASLGGEYNITAERSGAISLSLATISRWRSQHITKNFDSEIFRNFVDAFRAFWVCRQIRTATLPVFRSIGELIRNMRYWFVLLFMLQWRHQVLDKWILSNRRRSVYGYWK